MTCLISRDPDNGSLLKVTAPNQEPSLLYENILAAVSDTPNFPIDNYVREALSTGLIKNDSPAEIALALWSKIYTPHFIDWFGNWEDPNFTGLLDKNGEPLLTVDDKGVFWKANEPQYYDLQTAPDDLSYTLSAPAEEEVMDTVPQEPMAKRRFTRLQQELRESDPDSIYLASEQEDGLVRIQQILPVQAGESGSRLLKNFIGKLQSVFPSIQVQFITADDLVQFDLGAIDRDLVSSFIQGGTVYLVEDRFTPETMAEEFLHPFVATLQQENPELFGHLLAQAKNDHKNIVSLVNQQYRDDRGFTTADRENEIVSRAIANALSTQILQNLSVDNYAFARLLRSFLDFIKQVLRKLSGRDQLYAGDLPASLSISELITLLQAGTPVSSGPLSSQTYFHIQPQKLEVYNRLLYNATEKQREIVEKLAANNVLFYEDTHKYIHPETGEEFTSVTKKIKGGIDEEDPYAINRAFGKEFDYIMNETVLGTSLADIKKQLKLILPDVIDAFYNHFQIYLSGLRSNGSIVVPQLLLSDENSMVAGTLDLLLIDPEGNLDIIDLKVSKNTVLGKSYHKPWPITSELSVFAGKSLSTRAQHGIQQHSYKKLIELHQLPVRSVKTLHYLINVLKSKVIGFEPEGLVDHTTTVYSNEVNAIIPTELPKSRTFTTLLQAQALPENAPVVERIQDIVDDFKKLLLERKSYFENINQSTKGKTTASQDYMDDLAETVDLIEEEIAKGSPVGAFYHLLKYINRDLKKKTLQLGQTNIAPERKVDFLLETEKDVNAYAAILEVPQLQLNNVTLMKLSRESLDYIDSLRTAVDVEIKGFVRQFIQVNSSKTFTEEDLQELLTESKDISQADYLLGDLATSTDPMLAILDRVYKRKLQQIYDSTDNVAKELVELGNQLAKLNGGKADYNFMLHLDSQGKPTGYYIRKIGSQYWDKYKALRDATLDQNGVPLKYREVFSLQDADPEDLKYNVDLMHKKNAFRAFCEAEYVDETGELQDGIHHKYTDAFKAIRQQYEYLHVEKREGQVIYSEWRKKPSVSEENYKRYRAKYFTQTFDYLSPVKDQTDTDSYDYLGRVVEHSNRFVKSEFVEPREINGKGESMLDNKYEELMNPKTKLGEVQKQFYQTWVRHFEEQIAKLPTDVQAKMTGRLPVIRDRFVGTVKSKSPGLVKGILKGLRNLNPFDLKIYSQNVLTNERGEIEHQIPIYYVGDFQNEQAIQRLEEEISNLSKQVRARQITYEQYREELKKARLSLSLEKGKITRDEISTDMVANLAEFVKMAENYHVMSAFESTVESIKRTIQDKKFFKEGPGGMITSRNAKTPARFDGQESLVKKRLEKWMEMVFYRTTNPYQSRAGQIIRKMMQYMSLKNVALNPFGQVNNFLMGHLNNLRESIGGTFWDKEHYYRSIAEYHKDYLPGLIAKRSATLIGKGDYYEIDKPYSKYEALASQFRMMRKLQSADLALGLQDRIFDAAYVMQESAEYSIQTQTGMSALMAKMLTHEKTGEKLSVYDAYEFDQNTFSLKLKDGYSFTDQDRHDLTNLIYEINKRLHGNYAYEDRMVIQAHLLGELGAQFHKWVYPAIRSVVGGTYIDQNQGEQEGRHRSVWKFFMYLKDLRDLADSWDMLKPHQKKNVYKSSADLVFMLLSFGLYHLFMMIGQGIDEEDETTRKLVNWMSSQADRIYDEVAIGVFIVGTQQQYQLLKSPIALLGTAKDGMEVIYEALKAPLPPYDDLYFRKGVNKDELKLKKELMDVIPVLNLINRWDSYETVKQFYIR